MNQALYLRADTPPPPYSYIITQRDFVMFRGTAGAPARAGGTRCVMFRNGEHAGTPPTAALIRGETLGVIGFCVAPEPGGGCAVVLATAADPKGSIPAYLVNFVARRTPRMWAARVSKACARFAEEDAERDGGGGGGGGAGGRRGGGGAL